MYDLEDYGKAPSQYMPDSFCKRWWLLL